MIVYVAMSLDGYIADVDGGVNWLSSFGNEGTTREYKNFLDSVDNVIMGTNTYDQILTFGSNYPYESKMNYILTYDKSKYTDTENRKFINIDEIPSDIKNSKTWVVGGSEAIASLVKENLVDEFRISVMPIVLGNGIKLFNGIEIAKLSLEDSVKLDDVIELRYKIVSK